jgi:hypothetical protein
MPPSPKIASKNIMQAEPPKLSVLLVAYMKNLNSYWRQLNYCPSFGIVASKVMDSEMEAGTIFDSFNKQNWHMTQPS